MEPDAILGELGITAAWEERGDGRWAEAPDLDVRAMARLLRSVEARWVTLTVDPAPGGGFRLLYHWDLAGQLLNIATTVAETRADSIADIWPAADWAEREAGDYYAFEFAGRDELPALMLRPEDEPGLFSRTQTLGRDADPADAARLDVAHNVAAERRPGAGGES
jgi:hypothetical protein